MSKVYVGRLSTRTRERDLEDAFEKFGKILKVELKYGYAFLEFEGPNQAEDAVKEMDNRTLDDSKITVEIAKGRRDRRDDRGYDRRDRDRYDRRDDRRDRYDDRDRDRRRDGAPGKCFNCSKDGHWARDCPEGKGRDSCFNCGKEGHSARDCREPKGSRMHPYFASKSRSSRRSRSRSRDRRSRSRSPSRNDRDRSRRSRSRSPRRDTNGSPRRGSSPAPKRSVSPKRSPPARSP